MRYMYFYDTKMGQIGLAENGRALTHFFFSKQAGEATLPDAKITQTPLLKRAAQELSEYLDQKREIFTIPLEPSGTPFQMKVWQALLTIPYGKTKSYGEIAAQIGNPKASRAVGMANNKNPIAVFIPCHRVIGANGSMVGFGGGLHNKELLLRTEGLLL